MRFLRDFPCALRLAYASQEQKRLITEKIDETKLVTLGGNTTPAAACAENDRGAVPDEYRFEHMMLLLKRDPESEARLNQQIDAMHDPASPQFHHWMTAQQFGTTYGAHPQDMLKSHGFTVNQLYKSGLLLDIDGTAKQIRDTFHRKCTTWCCPTAKGRHFSHCRSIPLGELLAVCCGPSNTNLA
jgi:hypothetical protein